MAIGWLPDDYKAGLRGAPFNSLSRFAECKATKLGCFQQDRLADELHNEPVGFGGKPQYLAKLGEGLLGAPPL